MGFKADTSFLRFLSMGAMGVHQAMRQLIQAGFRPIELERYCGSNKIWATKVKRLRLPDILCVQTGLRVEVRAKSNLQIRMSDAPNNPDRRWDVGLRDEDLVAFIACTDVGGLPQAADSAIFFTVKALKDSMDQSKLGQPKSASEGAERDRTWPTIIPSMNGTVLDSNTEKLRVIMHGKGKPRKQTYTLRGKKVYVANGDEFKGHVTILAGAPSNMADLSSYMGRPYDPFQQLESSNNVDRYAAVKALRHREDLHLQGMPALEELLNRETEKRVALEAAGSSASLGSSLGQQRILDVLAGQGEADLQMEAVLILTELGNAFAREQLNCVANNRELAGDEIRQAAVWGLGKKGLHAYDDLVAFIGDSDENVALHAIAAFGDDTPRPVIERLVQELQGGDARVAPAASEALRIIGNDDVLEVVVNAARSGFQNDWAVATLGRLPPERVRQKLQGDSLLDRVAPMFLISESENWLSSEERSVDIFFLLKQNL